MVRSQAVAIGAVAVEIEDVGRGVLATGVVYLKNCLSLDLLCGIRVPLYHLALAPAITRPFVEDMFSHEALAGWM